MTVRSWSLGGFQRYQSPQKDALFEIPAGFNKFERN